MRTTNLSRYSKLVFLLGSSLLFIPGLLGPVATRSEPVSGPVRRDPMQATPWLVPFDVNGGANASQNDYYDLAWQSFIAVNWPARQSGRGAPNPLLKIGATDERGNLIPVVWEGYKAISEVFLQNAAKPADWDVAQPVPAHCNAPAGSKVLTELSKGGELNMAGFPPSLKSGVRGPLIDQEGNYVRFEVRMNRSEFTYVRDVTGYYNARTQETAVKDKKLAPPPDGNEAYVKNLPEYARQGTVEIKASWRE
ncbi:MAG TPA: hypothetical protein VJX67_05540, partial [Blastocatellia bacterium]|nr:hypothetical protein [Blastocatellia bacterium]